MKLYRLKLGELLKIYIIIAKLSHNFLKHASKYGVKASINLMETIHKTLKGNSHEKRT